MTNKNKNRLFNDFTNFIFENVKINKFLLIIISIITFIAFLTGIIVGAKTHSNIIDSDNFGVVDITTGGLTSTFFTRLLSMFFIMLILLGCSFTIYLLPIGIIFIVYRGYLLGLNICLMIVKFGFSGTLISIITAFPCQLIALAIMILFFAIMYKTNKDYRCWGGCRTSHQRLKIVLTTILSLFIICILEALLLALFSAKVILVI